MIVKDFAGHAHELWIKTVLRFVEVGLDGSLFCMWLRVRMI